ncbi:MAG: UvrD-helicase domain-containing protein [Defluviitaleaceae bacterium]|nr:UvrD-helicase domain-containing protein [Defluviitaleaceae bacterium]
MNNEVDFTAGLNPMQKAAVLHTQGPLLLIAGAGSGKTRVLTHRMAYIAQHLAQPYNILAITFTNRAAKEMKERIAHLAPQAVHDMWVFTFHACCVRILRREIHHLGYDNNFTIYDSDDAIRLMKFVIKDMNLNDKTYAPKSMLHNISAAKNEMIGAQKYAEQVGGGYRDEKIAQIYARYQKELYGNNALDFDDIILKTLELFAKHPEILEKYANRFRYIMVDEYQDTNTAQYNLVRMLASVHGNLCVVGDDDQSIYGWRGANIRNILDFEKDFAGAVIIKLEQNYRSTSNILNAANAVIRNNSSRKGKNLWTDADGGENITLHKAENDQSEAYYIVEKIEKGIAGGAKNKDFAVLYRTNAQSRLIEDRLVARNIPYRIFGGLRFYERREIKDALAYMRTIANPYDDVSLKRIINVPKRGIGDAAIEFFEKIASEQGIKFYDALTRCEEFSENKSRVKKIVEFVQLLESLREDASNLQLDEFAKAMLAKTGYYHAILEEDAQLGTDRVGNLSELINKVTEFIGNYNEAPNLSSFLEEVALVADIDSLKENDDAVALMTLHSSKGLEFNTVFLPGLEEGIFPGYRAATGSTNEMEEERRLCYVGITRARKQLYITHAARRMHNGQTNYNPPSRFLGEIPHELVDNEGMKSNSVNKTTSHRERLAAKQHQDTAKSAMQANFGKKWDISKIVKKK